MGLPNCLTDLNRPDRSFFKIGWFLGHVGICRFCKGKNHMSELTFGTIAVRSFAHMYITCVQASPNWGQPVNLPPPPSPTYYSRTAWDPNSWKP